MLAASPVAELVNMLLDAVSELHGHNDKDKMRWFATLACTPKGHVAETSGLSDGRRAARRPVSPARPQPRHLRGTSGAWRRPDQHQEPANTAATSTVPKTRCPGTHGGRRQGHLPSAVPGYRTRSRTTRRRAQGPLTERQVGTSRPELADWLWPLAVASGRNGTSMTWHSGDVRHLADVRGGGRGF